jgi:hypothetical protein
MAELAGERIRTGLMVRDENNIRAVFFTAP